MKPRICVCCGEPIRESGSEFSRNPNMCGSCSSMADGMEEDIAVCWETPAELPKPGSELERIESERARDDEKVLEWTAPPGSAAARNRR